MITKNKNQFEKYKERFKKRECTKDKIDNVANRVLNKPSSLWKYSGDEKALSYTLYNSLNSSGLNIAKRMSGNSPFIDFKSGKETVLAVAHSKDATRVQSKGKGLYGKSFVYIKHRENGMLFLDTKDKLFFQAENDQIVETKAGKKGDIKINNVAKVEHEGKTVNLVEVVVREPEKMTLKLWLWDDKETASYRKSVFSMIMGCPDKLTEVGFPMDELIDLGIPLKGEVFYGNELNEPSSKYFLQDLKLVKNDASAFSIPKGYRDLRKKEKSAKGHTYGSPIKMSSIRPRGKTKFPQRPNNNLGSTNKQSEGSISGNYHTAAMANMQAIPKMELPNVLQCLPSTYGSQIATKVRQLLADDIKLIVNTVSKRLTAFNGTNGKISIDWLNQFKAYSQNLNGGDGLYCLLRDEPDLSSSDPNEQMGGEGLLDKLVERMVRKLLVDIDTYDIVPDISSLGMFTLDGQLRVSHDLAIAITNILSTNSINPEDRYDALSNDNKRILREAYLNQNIGNIGLTYPESTGAQTIFHNLLKVKLDNIEFDINIDNAEIIDSLTVGDNLIVLNASLPKAFGKAWMSRWGTGLYWAVLGAGWLGCPFIPGFCFLMPFATTLAIFLAHDFSYVSIDLENININSEISFVTNTNGVLRPKAETTLDADVSVVYASVIPTGIHQIISAIISIVGSHMDIVLNELESSINAKLNKLLRNDLQLRFPPKFGSVPLIGLNSIASGANEDHIYLESELNAGLLGVINPYITQVGTNVRGRLAEFGIAFREEDAKYLRHYGGLVLSQNFINHYIHILWRDGLFNYNFTNAEASPIFDFIKDNCQGNMLNENTIVALWPAVSPRLVFKPCEYEFGKSYMTCFFDDLILCVKTRKGKEECTMEFRFSAKVDAEIGFGAVNSETGELDLMKVSDRFMDIYFDIENGPIEIIHQDTQGKFGCGDCFEGVDCEKLKEMDSLLEDALRAAIKNRNSNVIPRDSDDPITVQEYELAGQSLKFKFWIYHGNLYMHFALGGAICLLLDGTVNLDEIDCEFGTLIRSLV